ncbi:hypothetical protein ACFVIM_19765 [Streptomyces sp. NPDC057638]|uniref:hypothetical protein n=1 Tax=Streptomyces sp. NPDC057638 TaxID=3346190 RepID=UPI00368B3C6B
MASPTSLSAVPTATTSCPYSVPTYSINAGRITRYVDWDPKSTEYGHLFSSEKSATFSVLTALVPGGGTRLFHFDRFDDTKPLKSYQDKSESGGAILTPEYTFAVRAGQEWSQQRSLWTDGDGRLVTFDTAGALHVYVIQFPDGTPASARMSRLALLPATDPAVKALSKSTHVWAAGNKIYGYLDGTIRSWDYEAALNSITLGPTSTGTVVGTGVPAAFAIWSPAPGVFNVTDRKGTVARYGGTPLRLIDAEIAVGVTTGFANPASCLSSAPADATPHFGTKPDVSGAAPLDPPAPDPSPTGPATVSGRFTTGDGSPAAGLDVTVEAVIPATTIGEEFDLPDLGTVRTRADGTWSLALPDPLPTAAQKAAETNGGALNITASTTAVSSSGARLFGVDHRTAAPPDPVTGTVSRSAAIQSAEPSHTIELLPLLPEDAPENNLPEPTASQRASTYAASLEAETVYRDEPTPRWQSERGPAEPGYNPHIVNGKDISAERVSAYAGGGSCSWVTTLRARTYSYTTVGEAHSYDDSYAAFEYENKVQNTIDVAYTSQGRWKIGGSMTVGNSSGSISGYQAQGPFFSKQWRIPMEYHKQRRYYICGAQTRSSYDQVVPVRYTIPAGWQAGAYGKDVSHLDGGARYSKSNPSYRASLPRKAVHGVTRGKSVKWSGVASPFSLSLGGSLTYDTNHTQKILTQQRRTKYYVWGLYDKVSGRPGIMYAY